MDIMRRLKAPAGTDEANFGEQKFRVDNDGTVLVPQEAVAGLVGEGGFELLEDGHEVPHGFARVHHADPDAVCGGERLPDGSFLVPVEQVADLASHGFVGLEAHSVLVPSASGSGDSLNKDELVSKAELEKAVAEIDSLNGVVTKMTTAHDGLQAEVQRLSLALSDLQASHDAHAADATRLTQENAELHAMIEAQTAPKHEPPAAEPPPADPAAPVAEQPAS